MKTRRKFTLMAALAAPVLAVVSMATNPAMKNIGFESGSFNGWTGYTWTYSTEVPSVNSSKVPVALPTSRRQVIISDTTAYDANTGNALKKVPKGYRYSARLGDEIKTGDTNPRCWEQSLQYKMKVDSTNSLLIMKFACVLQYASDHTALMEPRFKLSLYDQSGNTINTCTNYDVYSSSSLVKGFQTYTPAGSANPVQWRDWTTVGADLSGFNGQNITIEFMSADCTGRYHYGYAYFVASYQSMSLTTKYCAGNDTATLTAPDGFESYKWKFHNNVVGSNSVYYAIQPAEGDTYTCVMTSATGCTDSLTTTIWRYEPKAKFACSPLQCNDSIYKVQFTNLSTTNRGTLSNLWNFGDGSDTTLNPTHAFTTSGWHKVWLTVTNSSSGCTDSYVDSVETFYPPLIGIKGDTTYCPGYTTTLKGYGADHYDWILPSGSIVHNVDSLVMRAPGGITGLTGYSSNGICSTTKYRTVIEEPEWNILVSGNPAYCKNDSTCIRANALRDAAPLNSTTFIWKDPLQKIVGTQDSLIVKTPGTYTLLATNKRGCQKSTTCYVTEIALPDNSFTMSATAINNKHNYVTFNGPAVTGVSYFWDLGDSTTESQSSFTHYYDVTGASGEYIVTMTATNAEGCISSSSKAIEVTPYVPNVFTPNGDGVNDRFMKGFELTIYDRNGIRFYQGIDGWDGTFKGKNTDPDTYYYVLHYIDKNKQPASKTGYITLIR
jgi:gliding motility-associated-like protein